jgi:molybdopterin converting factor small subunit
VTPVQIRVQYFGVVREMVGESEEILKVEDKTTMLQLIQSIARLRDGSLGTYLLDPNTSNVRVHPAMTYLMNGRMIPTQELGSMLLEDDSTVSIIPTQGG